MDIPQILADPCPNCGASGHLSLEHRVQAVTVKGEHFDVDAQYFHCASCEADFDAASSPDPLADAYSMYRAKHGLVTPEQLRAWRLRLELKQSELAAIMGWSTATVSRYENGALQDDAHDRAMKAAMTPEGLLAVVGAAENIPDVVRERLHAKANAEVGGTPSLLRVLSSRFAAHSAETSFDFRKTAEMVLYFCHATQGGVPRTKLNKLLWYADFLHTKYFGRPVTGMPYVRLQFGPVPESYELLFMALQSDKLLEIATEEFEDGRVAHMHHALRAPELTALSPTELQAVARVQSELGALSAKAIAERSHTEEAWLTTPQGQLVDLRLAASLNLGL